MNLLEWIVLIGAALSAVIYIGRKFAILFKTWFKFISDWNGTEESPGVVERLKQGNERFEKIEREISDIKEQLFPNSGSSLRDSIIRIEEHVSKKPPRKTSQK